MAYTITHSDNNQTFTDVDFEAAADDAVLTSGNSNTYRNCRFRSSVGHGLAVSGTGNVYINCVIENNGEGGLVVNEGATGTRFIHCIFYNNAGVAPDISESVEFTSCVFHSQENLLKIQRGKALKGANNYIEGIGLSRDLKPSDIQELDPDHALYDSWKMYVHVDQKNGSLINLADRSINGVLSGNASMTLNASMGRVVSFDGASDDVSFGNSIDPATLSAWSIGAVFSVDDVSTAIRILYSKLASPDQGVFQVFTQTNGRLTGRRLQAGGTAFLESNMPASSVINNQRHVFVMTMDEAADILTLYFDDAAAVTDITTSGTKGTGSTANVKLGGRDAGDFALDGDIKTAFFAATLMDATAAAAWIADPESPLLNTSHKPQANMGLPWAENLVMLSAVEGPYTTVRNLADGSLNGSLSNMAYTQNASYGEVLDFSGNDYVDFGAGFNVAGYAASAWSFGALFKIDDLSSTRSIISKVNAGEEQWDLSVNTTGDIAFTRYNTAGAAYVSAESAARIATGAWYGVGGIMHETDGAEEIKLYVGQDAVVSASALNGTIENTATAQFRLGRRDDGVHDLDGQVAMAWLASAAIGGTAMQAWIKNPFAMLVDGRKRETTYTAAVNHPLYKNITRLYALSEGTGSSAADLMGNRTGTLGASAFWNEIDGVMSVNFTDTGGNAHINASTSPFSAAKAGTVVAHVFIETHQPINYIAKDGGFALYTSITSPDELRLTLNNFATNLATGTLNIKNRWVGVVATWDAAGNASIWVEGKQYSGNAGVPKAPTAFLFIGNDSNQGDWLDGSIAFFSTLNKEITDAQAKSLSLNPYQLLHEQEQAFVNTSILNITTGAASLFKDAANSNYRPLNRQSLLVDAGAFVSDRGADFYGNPGLQGLAPDIGIQELPGGTPFVVQPDDGAVVISAEPTILEGAYLSAVGGNASLWVLNSSAPKANINPTAWDNRIPFFVGRGTGRRFSISNLALTAGLTVSLSGTGASAVLEYTNRDVV